MTQVSPTTSAYGTSFSGDHASKLQRFWYYFSFILVFSIAAFIAGMLMMGYEDKSGNLLWQSDKMNVSDKIGFIGFYILQFPLGLLYGLFTGNYHNGLFALLLNPLLVAWTLQRFFIKTGRRNTRRAFHINYSISMALILTIVIYIMTQ